MSSDEENGVHDGATRKKILDTLEKYGDSLLVDDAHQPKQKRKRKRKDVSVSLGPDNPQESLHSTKKKKKKKRRKALSEGDVDEKECKEDSGSEGSDSQLHGEERHLQQLKEKLGLTSQDFLRNSQTKQGEKTEKEMNLKTTKISSNSTGKRPPPEIIVFQDPAKANKNKVKSQNPVKSRRETVTSHVRDVEQDTRHSDVMMMRQAKFDVQMLGITGMQKVDKEKAKLDLLVKLGAKAPKNKYVNYKEFQQIKKKEKAKEVEQRELEREMGTMVTKANIRKRRQRDRNDIGFLDGQVGKYKSGVQVLSQKQIDKVKTRRR